ncbi:hypothetical protein [Tessaracoccus defluvii]|uniref:Uncharacterized protein n=1 Tax=Tessaracoccus defluvii TaxID=1285901 RepID=A0A7H0H7Q0_9ACTN|nr:hypothetical protein [Tessaracoccus defluvii]QNP56566.1 hypothetical protein H9L22_03870 [Tessaracoccus defluvii]
MGSGRGISAVVDDEGFRRPDITYDEWNRAIADVVYPEQPEAAPVYLALDESTLAELGAVFDLPQDQVVGELARSVKHELRATRGAADLRSVTRRLDQWRARRSGPHEPPPVLAFLTVLCLAAERMANDSDMAAANFYGRVGELLEIPSARQKFAGAYRDVAEDYWFALEDWLERLDGLRGLPTAVAVGHRFIGLPISQVLVRASDRARLPEYFEAEGLAPRSVIPASELQHSFQAWIEQPECRVSKQLRGHWARSSARQRILEVVANSLAAWDGVSQGGEGQKTAKAVLSLTVGTFPRRGVRMQPVAYVAQADTPRTGEIRTSGGWVAVDLVPRAPGLVDIGQGESMDTASLLEGIIRVRDPHTDTELLRQPRGLSIFRRHEALKWVEADRTMLGEDLMLVVRDHEKLVKRVNNLLTTSARTGWGLLDPSFPGHPPGWLMYQNVQLLRAPDVRQDDLDLGALVPLAQTQMTVSGGFSLPGSVKGKWHREALPEVRVVSDDTRGFALRLIDFGPLDQPEKSTTLVHLISDGPGALVMPLANEELEDGNYRAELVDSEDQVTSSTMIRVRSADTPDVRRRTETSAANQFTLDPLCVISASQPSDGPSISGAVVSDPQPFELMETLLPEAVSWQTERTHRVKLKVGIERIPADSCVYTGSHHRQVETAPTDRDHRPLTPYVESECSKCHVKRRYPTTPRSRRTQRPGAQPSLERLEAPPVFQSTDDNRWNTVLDAVRHCGAGSMGALSRIASFADAGALTLDHLQRTLTALGHIDVLRDCNTLELKSWDLAPTALVKTRRGWFLAGDWSQGRRLTTLRANARISFTALGHGEAPDSWFFSELPEDASDISVVDSPLDLARELPLLSEVLASLPRVPAMRRATGLSHFDPRSAKWNDAEGMGALGGYRLRGFSTDDFLRTDTDLDHDTMARSTVQLSKHATALLWRRRPLLAYDRRTQILRVPLGANLPGLYERAVVGSSGIAPKVVSGCLEYPDVTPEIAGHIGYLLTN